MCIHVVVVCSFEYLLVFFFKAQHFFLFLLGMSYLHDHDFVHRNLTSSAVLLTSNLRAKIDIFELGNDSEMSTRAMYFNIPWMAPEVHITILLYL